jgi:hypothetical protein
MGLSDRDYMNERRPPEVKGWARQPSSLRSTLWMILTWVSILFLLYKSFLWWEGQKKPVNAINPNIEVTVPRVAPVESRQVTLPPTPVATQQGLATRQAPVHSGDRTVTKCMVNGQVIFTDRDCPTGAKESSVTVNTANVGTVASLVPDTPPPQVQHRNVVTTTTTYSTNGMAGIANANARTGECAYLEIRIKQIDAQSRQPLSGQAQDTLTAERTKVRSRQYELHC